MRVLQIQDVDIVNYKKTAMFIGTVICDGKCWKELGLPRETCQNSDLYNNPNIIYMNDDILCRRYLENPMSEAIVIGGLEPMLQLDELYSFIKLLREKYHCDDDVVIYTGYTEKECKDKGFFDVLNPLKNIIYKVGRYIPNKPSRYDEILGVTLISDNQYGLKYTLI